MKRSFFRFCLPACILLCSVACSRSEKLQGNEFLIEGEISGVEDGAVITLMRTNDNLIVNGYTTVTTDTIINGRFTFKGEAILNQDWLAINCRSDGFPSSSLLTVWVAPKAKVKIKGQGKMLPLWSVKSSVPNQKEENRYHEKNRDLIAEDSRLNIERNDAFKKMDAATSEEEALAYRDITRSLLVLMDSLREKQYFAEIEIMEQTKITDVWLNKMYLIVNTLFAASTSSYVTLEQAEMLRKKAETLYGKISEDDKNTPVGQLITVKLFPPSIVGVGDDMADADLLGVNGETNHLSDYSGKYLLLDFWSRGCGPCIMALPEMKEISETYSDKLTIISISLDIEDWWKEAMTMHDMPWVNIRDPKSFGGLAASYGVVGIPNYVIISPEGKIIDKWAGYGTGYLKMKVSQNIN